MTIKMFSFRAGFIKRGNRQEIIQERKAEWEQWKKNIYKINRESGVEECKENLYERDWREWKSG